jgi:hypothetical protein
MAALTAEDPAIGGNAEGVDVLAQDGDQLGRDRYPPCLTRRTVLESAFVVGRRRVGPAPVDLGPRLLQGETAPAGSGQVAVLPSQRDCLSGS